MPLLKLDRTHTSITRSRVCDAVERQTFGLDNPGFCLNCGEEDMESDPDTRNKECEHCGRPWVFGAAELLIADHYFLD
jgi:hypothetical protein